MIKRLGIRVDVDHRQGLTGLQAMSRGVRAFALEVAGASQGVLTRSAVMAGGVAAAGIATKQALDLTIGSAIGFEVEMRNVNSIMHQSEEQFARTSAQVLNLGKELPQDAQTLARGLYDIASSGFQGGEGLMVLEASAKAATAGMTDTATAARGITAVLNAYGLEAKDASDVSDILFQTVNLGVVTFEELASQLGDVVGIAAAANIGIDEVGSALAAMTLSGISAAESSTSLNRLIQSLLQPSETLAAVWRSVSNESLATTLSQEGLHSVMSKLYGVVGDNVQVLLALFPEIRAARGAFALLANEGQNYLETQQAITDEQRRANATQKAFDEQMKATGNQLKLVGNNVKIWALDMGSKALPALQALIQRSRDFARVVVPAFRTFGDVLGYVGELLVDHREIIFAIGIAYGTKVLASLVRVSAELLVGAARWVIYQAEVLKATAAAFGLSFAMSGIITTAAGMGAALIAGLAVKNWMEAKEHAKEMVSALKEGVDTDTLAGLDKYNKLLREQQVELQAAQDKSVDRTGEGGWVQKILAEAQKLEDLLPWADDKHAKNTAALAENRAEQKKTADELEHMRANLRAAGEATGATTTDLEKLAKELGIDLTQGGTKGRQSVDLLVESFERTAEGVGLTREQLAQLGVEGVEAISKIQEAAADARREFEDTFGLLADFEFPDAKTAAEDLAEASEKVAEAEERLADARTKVHDNEAFISRTPERDRELAKARHEVADAERDVADAREEARQAALVANDPEAALKEQYEKQISEAKQFTQDLATVAEMAAKRDLPLADFLLKASLNPEEFAPILRAIAEDTDGTLIAMIAESESRLKELGATYEAQVGVLMTAVENGMTEVNDIFLQFFERTLTDPDGKKALLAYEFGAAIGKARAKGEKAGYQEETGAAGTADGNGDGITPSLSTGAANYNVADPETGNLIDDVTHGVRTVATILDRIFTWASGNSDTQAKVDEVTGRRAMGAVDAHVATKETILFGERSTGGEAFIPLGTAHRGRSTMLLGRVAEMFGYGLIPMAHGGIHAAGISGGSSTTRNYHSKQISQPINIYGDVRPNDYRDFERQMDRKRRKEARAGL